MQSYLTVIEAKDLEQSNIEAKIRTLNMHDLFYAPKTNDSKTTTHYISHHPFDEQEAANMREYFTHFYDMSETTIDKVFADLNLSDLPYDEELI